VGVDFVIKHVCDNKKGGERERVRERERERGLFNLKQSLDVAQPKREIERRVKPETVM
jgi:hypothetical protein